MTYEEDLCELIAMHRAKALWCDTQLQLIRPTHKIYESAQREAARAWALVAELEKRLESISPKLKVYGDEPRMGRMS